MSSIQERLQLKRVPLDTWNIREQLCLASAVVQSGDQNWMSVSRALKTVGEPNRPPDWYSQKSCAAQYGALLEHVETPKRKKRSSEGAVETPQESILKRLTQERIVEIQKTLAEMNQQYDQLKTEITEARNPSTSEDRLRELWSNIEASKRAKERENARRAAWLKEREERRARADRTWRPPQPTTPTSPASTAPPSSPLLTSLLKSSPVVTTSQHIQHPAPVIDSSPVVTTPQHIPHPATVVETVSPSATAPTLSMLLEKPAQHESKHAAIEHIKSQLVQIEQQLIASTSASPVPLTPAPAVDIDDIEIKAEDVYAFRDINIHIPPVTAMHKGNVRVVEKPVLKKEDVDIQETVVEETQNTIEEVIKEEPMVFETVPEEVIPVEIAPVPEEPQTETEVAPIPEAVPEVKIAFPEVKFPTVEIKVIQPDELKIKEEVKEPEIPLPEPEKPAEEEVVVEETPEPVVEQEEIVEPPPPQPEVIEPPPPPVPETPLPVEDIPAPEDIPLPPEPIVEEVKEETVPEPPKSPEPPLPPPPPEPIEPPPESPKPETIEETKEEKIEDIEVKQEDVAEESVVEDVKKEDDEDSIPLKEMMAEESARHERRDEAEGGGERARDADDTHTETDDDTPMETNISTTKGNDNKRISVTQAERRIGGSWGADADDTHTETDDNMPMELSREEEKDGKKKKDYSRKKKSDSRTCSGSESAAEASAPDSPSANDSERQHRLWKKSVMLVYSRLCAHKYASLFLRPISDEEAPGYSMVVKRPMDLTAIRRNIENGAIRTTAEFQRDVLLMLSNALMYNSSEHSVYSMAKEMHEEAQCQLGMLLAAQAHAGLSEAPLARRKRRRPDSPQHANKRH